MISLTPFSTLLKRRRIIQQVEGLRSRFESTAMSVRQKEFIFEASKRDLTAWQKRADGLRVTLEDISARNERGILYDSMCTAELALEALIAEIVRAREQEQQYLAEANELRRQWTRLSGQAADHHSEFANQIHKERSTVFRKLDDLIRRRTGITHESIRQVYRDCRNRFKRAEERCRAAEQVRRRVAKLCDIRAQVEKRGAPATPVWREHLAEFRKAVDRSLLFASTGLYELASVSLAAVETLDRQIESDSRSERNRAASMIDCWLSRPELTPLFNRRFGKTLRALRLAMSATAALDRWNILRRECSEEARRLYAARLVENQAAIKELYNLTRTPIANAEITMNPASPSFSYQELEDFARGVVKFC